MRQIKDRKTTLRLETALDERLERFAESRDMSKALVIRMALKKFLDAYE